MKSNFINIEREIKEAFTTCIAGNYCVHLFTNYSDAAVAIADAGNYSLAAHLLDH